MFALCTNRQLDAIIEHDTLVVERLEGRIDGLIAEVASGRLPNSVGMAAIAAAYEKIEIRLAEIAAAENRLKLNLAFAQSMRDREELSFFTLRRRCAA